MPSFQQWQVFSTSPVSRADSLLLQLEPRARERSPQGRGLELNGVPGYRNRHVGMVTAKEALAGSEADLLVMSGISFHHFPACSSSPWCFPPPSPSSQNVDFPAALPQYIPTPASAVLLSQSLPFPGACCPPPLPSHSWLLGWFPRLSIPLFSWAPPYTPHSLWRLCPSMRFHLQSILVTAGSSPC